MKKSLFTKIFSTQILVALTVVLIIVPMIFILIGDYFVASQKDDVLEDATRVARLSSQFSEVSIDERTKEFYISGLELVGGRSCVVVVDTDGHVVAVPENISGIDLSIMDADFIDEVRSGKYSLRMFEGGKLFEEQSIVAIVPIMRATPDGKGNFMGAAVAFRPIPEVRGIQYKIIKIILMAQIVAWLVALIVSFIITRQITKPIKKMRSAARKLASGNFNERIPITSQDEIGELAQSFNSMTQSLSELEDMRTSFLSDVSHELRTPMTIISGFVEGILDGTIPESEREKYLTIVSDEAKRLSRLVKDLLEATRLEQGTKKPEKISFDINRLVTESIISYEQQLTEKNISVSLNLQEKENYAFADKDSIKRVLINLIDNAIKFTPKNGSISVSAVKTGGKIRTSIENTGDGISKEDLRHIWERFYKSDKSRSVDKKGVGLGLHIVKMIIAQHNGEIFAESEEGKYARFTFIIDAGTNMPSVEAESTENHISND